VRHDAYAALDSLFLEPESPPDELAAGADVEAEPDDEDEPVASGEPVEDDEPEAEEAEPDADDPELDEDSDGAGLRESVK
jgi:hypothetical protein